MEDCSPHDARNPRRGAGSSQSHTFGREVCGDLNAALRREWLVTNGLGGYASGTLAGIATRRYHGLLIAALEPPVGRTVLVAGMAEEAAYDGRGYPLSTHEFADGTIAPRGYLHLESFALDGTLPIWTFALGDALIERRLWMARDANTTYVTWRLARGQAPAQLTLTPFVTRRDFHTLTRADPTPSVEPQARAVTILAPDRIAPLRIVADRGAFTPRGGWWWNFRHREETTRGLDDTSDLYAPGAFTVELRPGEQLTLVFTAEDAYEPNAATALDAERARQRTLLDAANVPAGPMSPMARQLTLAADQFIVTRRFDDGACGPTVIAGYHWFNDWGRDTMIALPGLTLATGRSDDGASILRGYARLVVAGLLPNDFPSRAGAAPKYNTADAALWFVVALWRHHAATGDDALAHELLPVLSDIVEQHVRGTRHGIGVDPADGLLRAGEPGVQVTWMDARVGDQVVTPRIGKPVEINALWHTALRALVDLLTARDAPAAAEYGALADRAGAAFRSRFIRSDVEHLADVVDGPEGDDWSLRPNQLFAVSLPWPLLEGADAERVVASAGRALLTSYGLRSLAPNDPRYRGAYAGGPRERDGAYHQGPAWSWLLGSFAEAHYRVHGDRTATLAFLAPLARHLHDAGLGTVSELFEGDPPHAPRGTIAQAWGVAETLRVLRLLA